MKKSLLFLLFLLPAALFAQKAIEIKLWPDGAPNDNGILQEDLTDPDYPRNTREAILYVYPAEKGNGLSVVACPGGGYSILAMHHEGTDMAAWFNSQGITYAVLRYRMPNGRDEVPLSDVHQAIRVMRSHADDWQVKKVGVMVLRQADIWQVRLLPILMRKPVLISRFFFIRSSVWTRK